jgi:hypothetical protein
VNIQFVWQEDIERENRGFICHQLSALHNGSTVGYIKVAYIPKTNFLKYYPSIWEYKTRIDGWCYGGDRFDSSPVTREQKLSLMHGYIRDFSDWSFTPISKITNKEQQNKAIQQATEIIEEGYNKAFKEFKGYHCDRPYIAFISVNDDWRRKGIATSLMFKCHKILQKKGLRLHLSETICDGGKGFFDNFIVEHKDKLELKKVPNNPRKKLHALI